MSAVGFLLEKQQERIAEQRKKQQEQVEQTEQHEQQPRKPYGLSIDELLEGFDKKRDDESGKIVNSLLENKTYPFVENAYYSPQDYQPFYNYNLQYGLCDYPAQYPFVENTYNTCNYSLEENPSFSEQGICIYSTEHFYTLTVPNEEKAIIKELLIEKIKQNKADQEKLKTMSERLEASKIKQFEALMVEQQKTNKEEISKISSESGGLNDKNFIIKYNYLKESLERFTQNTEKLKELCAKFDIKGIKLSEPEQKEDSSSRKRSIDSCLGEMVIVEEISDMENPTKYQNIMPQSNNGQKQRNTARAGARTQKAL